MNTQKLLAPFIYTWKGDLSGALMAAIIGLPMGLAFGVQSGLGPQAGIYTAIILAFIAGLFGGTKTLITDPTGPMTVVAATVVGMGITTSGDVQSALPLIIGTFVLAGIVELVFGLFDFGKYVKYMPYPVLSGFMAGIGVIIISMQIFPILGYASPKGFTNIISNLGTPLQAINYQALFLGGMTMAIIYLLPKASKRVPSILISLLASTLISVGFNFDVPVIGTIPTQLPTLHLGALSSLDFSDVSLMIQPAIMLGGLGVIDSLLTSIVADNITRTKHNSRWTVIGQGVGNIITGLFGGIPGAGATMGTVTNIKAGAQTKLSGILKGVFLLLIVVGIADYVEYIPMAVLAGILITIGVSIIDYKGIKMLLKVPKQDAIVWSIVLAITLFDNLLDAVGVGFTLSAILFIGRMAKNMTATQTTRALLDVIEENTLPTDLADKIYVHNLEGPLFFGFAHKFRSHCEEIKDVIAIIIRMEKVPFLDQSGMVTLDSVIRDWNERGIQVYFTGINKQVKKGLENVKVIPELVKEEHCFSSFGKCLKKIYEKTEGKQKLSDMEEVLLDRHILENRQNIGAP